jgi:hypothetical protein
MSAASDNEWLIGVYRWRVQGLPRRLKFAPPIRVKRGFGKMTGNWREVQQPAAPAIRCTSTVSCNRISCPVANRPRLAKLPHNCASTVRTHTLGFKPICREIALAPTSMPRTRARTRRRARRSSNARRMASVLVSWVRRATSAANRSTSAFSMLSPMAENHILPLPQIGIGKREALRRRRVERNPGPAAVWGGSTVVAPPPSASTSIRDLPGR